MSATQPTQPNSRFTARTGATLLAVGLLAALAYLGYDRLLKPRSAASAQTLDLSAEALDRRLLAAEQALAADQSERRNLQQRLDESSSRTSLLRDEMLGISERATLIEDSVRELGAGGRSVQESLRVNEAEMLLGMSRERWLLSGDLSGTTHALELAANAIGGLKGPQWLNLRQIMAQELAAFRAIETDPRAIARGELENLLDLGAHGLQRDVEAFERLGRDPLALVDEAEQDVLGADVVVVEHPGLFLRQHHNPSSPVGKSLEHRHSLS